MNYAGLFAAFGVEDPRPFYGCEDTSTLSYALTQILLRQYKPALEDYVFKSERFLAVSREFLDDV